MKKILLLILCILNYTIANSQWWIPNEYFGKGQYWETDAYNYQNYPYTIFSHANGLTIEQQKVNLKGLINLGKPLCDSCPASNEFYSIYKKLWEFAWSKRPEYTQNGEDNEESADPNTVQAWAKAHAFICFLGIKYDGTPLSSADFETLAWTAEDALVNMNTDVEWWEYKKLLGRSRELIAAVQAYDLLKACGRLKDDRNPNNINPRDNIRKFARDIYNEANDYFGVLRNPLGWKKNHGISVAASLGIAAIVLNECGAGYFYDGWKADNWARIAHWGIMHCLFDASYGAVSKKGDIYSFSEGPGYFQYSMIETALPFFIAFNNFVPKSHNSWKFPYGTSESSNNIKNYMHNQDIRNLFEWYHQIQLPNGMVPTYDNPTVRSLVC